MKKIIDLLFRKPYYLNKTVIHFTTHGCMGTIHEFDWIGKIVGITYPEHCCGTLFYKIKILKDRGGELRNNNLKDEFTTVPSFYLQDLGGNFYIAYD